MNRPIQPENFSSEQELSTFTSTNLAALAVYNTTLMIVYVITNAFVMFLLIKTEQIWNITCELIFIF